MLSDHRKYAVEQFIELNASDEEESFEISASHRKSDAHIRRIIKSELDIEEPALIKGFEIELRDAVIKKLVEEKGISKSALERETGLSHSHPFRAYFSIKSWRIKSLPLLPMARITSLARVCLESSSCSSAASTLKYASRSPLLRISSNL